MKQQPQYFAHFDIRDGRIIGLYNTEKHRGFIPKDVVRISAMQRDQIVESSSQFRVDVEKKILVAADAEEQLPPVDTSAAKYDHDHSIAGGAKYKDVWYYADDEASAHATQCLVLYTADTNVKAKLKASINGSPEYVEVKGKDLVRVVQEINSVRLKAKEKLVKAQRKNSQSR